MEVGGNEESEPMGRSRPLKKIQKFLEVTCKSSGRVRRFAAGTEAGFALNLINRKLGIGVPAALLIQAIKDGEEPISFGPNAILVNYGEDWKLQAVTEEGYEEEKQMQRISKPIPILTRSSDLHSAKKVDLRYMRKILAAFAFIFLLGGTLTLFLENLPRLILFVSSSF